MKESGSGGKWKKAALSSLGVLLLLTGCRGEGGEGKIPVKESILLEQMSQEAEVQETQPDEITLPEVDCSGIYYKVQMKAVSYDSDAIMDKLLFGLTEEKIREQESDGGIEYFVEVDGVKHFWEQGDGEFRTFYYRNDSVPGREVTEEEALVYCDAFVEQIGYEVLPDPGFHREEDGSLTVEYSLPYEGVQILGNDSYWSGDGEKYIYGQYISVSVNDKGICNVRLFNLQEPETVLEEYQGTGDFISMDLLKRAMETYRDSNSMCSIENIHGIDLIYVPYVEEGNLLLLPAFRIQYEMMTFIERWEGRMLVDAVSGYVLDAD